MSRRLRHYEHVVRMLSLFAGALAVFFVVRWVLVPADFGVYGFYRAGALNDVRARAPVHAGETACLECHGEVGELKQTARHKSVRCEACHGPLGKHASGDFDVKPRALNPRTLCLTCHTQAPGRPATFPQIIPADHGGDGPCTECHKPHRPRID